jgi:hypothetical protein
MLDLHESRLLSMESKVEILLNNKLILFSHLSIHIIIPLFSFWAFSQFTCFRGESPDTKGGSREGSPGEGGGPELPPEVSCGGGEV